MEFIPKSLIDERTKKRELSRYIAETTEEMRKMLEKAHKEGKPERREYV